MTERSPHRTDLRRLGLEFVVAIIAVVLLVYFSLGAQQQSLEDEYRARLAVPPEAWFDVYQIDVPNHASGSNPTIIYDRLIKEEFTTLWVVEVRQQQTDGSWFSVCSGSATNDYDVVETIPESGVTWKWFIQRECAVPPGTYQLRVSWTMRRPEWPTKRLVRYSNVFEVT